MDVIPAKQGGMELFPAASAPTGNFVSIGYDCRACTDYDNYHGFYTSLLILKTAFLFISHFGAVFPAGSNPAQEYTLSPISL